jgi:hypothetical protein
LVQQSLWAEEFHPRSCQFYRQGQAIQPDTDLGHTGRILVGEGEIGHYRLRALDE